MQFSANDLVAIIERGIKRSAAQKIYIPRQLAISLKKATILAFGAKPAVAFSGGLDSTIIAKIALEKDPEVPLVCAGFVGSKDLDVATRVASELKAKNFITVKLDEGQVLADLEECRKIAPSADFLSLELAVGAYVVCKAAKEAGATQVLFGSGAEELFAGYERHYEKYEAGEDLMEVLKTELRALPKKDLTLTAKIASHFGLDAAFPFIDEDVITIAYGCVAEEKIYERDMKKPQLRVAAEKLGLPQEAVHRPKLAMQYGMGIHKILSQKYNDNPEAFGKQQAST